MSMSMPRPTSGHFDPATKDYGVYLHSSGIIGGYVVRARYDGWCPAPYSGADPVAIYKREHAAQRYADKLNDHRFDPEVDLTPVL